MDRDELRNQLFEKYFELDEGIILKDLVKDLSFVVDIYKDLHKLFVENIVDYEEWSSLEKIKVIEYEKSIYLIFKFSLWEYLIIDLNTRKCLSRKDVLFRFNEEFFIDNFSEVKVFQENFFDMYDFYIYDGNINELINFYYNYEKIFKISNSIFYKISLKDFWSYIYINLVKGTGQLGFESHDQFLYEHLFFNYDLTPFVFQDAVRKIGKDKMNEMFERIGDIKIPKKCIPIEFLQNAFMSFDDDKHKLIKKKA